MEMKLFTLLYFILILSMIGCATNPVTGESEFSLVSESQEIQIGEQYYMPAIQSFDGIYQDEKAQAYVTRVGKKIASLSHRPNFDYEFKIVNTSMVNAFALPGGKVCITRGLLSRMTNESQLAAVLGHEIGHVTAKHGAKAMTRQMLLGGLLNLGAIALESQQVKGREAILMAGAVGFQAVIAKYSRGQEIQSDELGLEYMTRANYNPKGAVELFEIFEALQEREPNFVENMFASHPQSKERVAHAKALIHSKYILIENRSMNVKNSTEFTKLSGQLTKETPYYDAHEKGREAALKKQWNKAIWQYEEALKGKPKEALFHSDIGFAYLMTRDFEKSKEHLTQALEFYPSFFKSNFYLGYLHYEQENYSSALRYLHVADQLVPGLPMLRLILGNSYEELGDVRMAVQHYKYVYQLDPNSNLGQEARSRLIQLGVME